MKGIFKLFPAALAMFALASCSSDDLLQVGDKAPEQNLEQGDLIITYDPLDNAVTRGYRQGDFGKVKDDGTLQGRPMVYAENDVFKVYDPDMFKYEAYKYNYNGQGSAFFKSNNVTITDPQFVLFPGDQVLRGYYNSDDEKTYAEINIPHIITYDANSEAFIDEDNTITGYAYNLPMLGIANPLDDGKMGASKMRHLTAILKLDLENVFGNASWLRIKNAAGKVMSGTIAAALDVSSEDARKAVKLDASLNKSDLITYTDMFIDLRNIPSGKSVIFIPILDGLDGDTDGIKLEYTAFTGEYGTTKFNALYESTDPSWSSAANDAKWVDTGMEFPGIEFKHNNLYEGSNVFAFDDMSPAKVSQLLEQYKASTQPITIDLTKNFTIADAYAEGDYNVYMQSTDKNITINLASTFTTLAVGSGGFSKTLNFLNKDGEDYTGTLTLNVGDKLPASANFPLSFNLPNANVVILGDFDNVDDKALTFVAAKSVTIGAEGKATKVTQDKLTLQTIGDEVKAFTIAKDAEVNVTAGVVAGKNTAAVLVEGTLKGAIAGGLKTTAITVNGTMTGDITGSTDAEASLNTITIGEGATLTGNITGNNANEKAIINGSVTGDLATGKANKEIKIGATGSVNKIESTSEQDNSITIEGAVASDVTSTPTETVSSNFSSRATTLTVTGDKGRVGGNIDLSKNVKGLLAISATPTTKTTGDDVIVTGDVTTGGNVIVALTAGETLTNANPGEGVAIGGTLEIKGALKKLKLVQGYINKVKVNVINSGSWENKKVNIILNGDAIGDEGTATEGIAAIKDIEEPADAGVFTWTESVWDGKTPTNTTYAKSNFSTPVAGKSQHPLASAVAILTATQLAYYQANEAGTLRLFNDFDMNNKAWKGIMSVSAGQTFFGHENTIENLTLDATKATANGLFATVGSEYTIQDVKLKNVAANLTVANNGGIGAVIGTNTAAVTVKNVDVTLKNVFGSTSSDKSVQNVGGVIGLSSGKAALEDVTVTGKLGGYSNLGGLIGKSAGNQTDVKGDCVVTLDASTPFTQNYASGFEMDMSYASIGTAVGTISGGSIHLRNLSKFTGFKETTKAYNNRGAVCFASSSSATDGNFYWFERIQNFVGYSGKTALGGLVYTGGAYNDYATGTDHIGQAWNIPDAVPMATGYTTTYSLYKFVTKK